MDNGIRHFANSEMIFKEGAYEQCMYEILSGSVDIYVQHGTENEKLLTTLEAGRFFGEVGLAEVMPRTATAIAAQDDTRLAVITPDNFSSYFSQDAQRLFAIMRNMSSRLRSLTQDYLEAREAVLEAVNTARSGAKRSTGLADRLSRLVQNSIRPAFLKGSGSFDEAATVKWESAQEQIIKHFRRNDIIFREGDAANCMYYINWGKVGIYANYGAGNEKLLAQLNPEEFFGEMGMLDKLPRSATAVAMEPDTKVQLITEETFENFLKTKPSKVMSIMMHLSSRIRALTKDYMQICRMAETAASMESESRADAWADESITSHMDALDAEYEPI